MAIKQRARSPRYPSASLAEAQEMAAKIYASDGMNAVDRESAVEHLGYSSLNGASATALATLKQYGLAADAGKGMLQLTPLALDLIEPEGDEEYATAVSRAAFTPDLFASLRERFPATVPSESNLRAHLLRHDFTAAAVKSVVPAYLETCEYVASVEVSERNGLPPDRVSESSNRDTLEGRSMTINPQSKDFSGEKPSSSITQGRRMVFDTEEGEVIFTYPESLSEESVEDIEEWFALVAKRLRRATKQ